VADVTQVLFFHQNQPYQIKHPQQDSDVSTILVIDPPTLLDILRTIELSVVDQPEMPFIVGNGLAGTPDRIQFHRILQRMKDSADPIEIEESVLLLAASVWRHTLHTNDRLRWRPRPQTAREQNEIVSQAKLVLSERFRKKITLDQLARTVHVSPYHLCRIFKREAGLSIHRYLQRLRLLNALEHIAECPKDNLTVVALGHGFSSHSHFSTTFQREFGVSPSAFSRAASKRLIGEMSKNLKAK
jgi:AraC-like DNA-binding protein